MKRYYLLSVSIVALGFAGTATARADTEIGGVAAANPLIQGTSKSDDKRTLLLGDRVLQDERIVTSSDGSGQLLFLDQTSLTIAPDSDIVLDRYVYDPTRTSGDIGLSITRGALRFIGGRVTKFRDAIIATPAATIGVRGGAALIEIEDDGSVTVIHITGERSVIEANGETLTMSRPTTKATISAGSPPVYNGIVDAAEFERRFAQFEGGGGGMKTTLSEDDTDTALDAGLSDQVSGKRGAVSAAQISTSGARFEGETTSPDSDISPLLDITVNPVPPVISGTGTPVQGASGVAAIAPRDGFAGVNGAVIDNPGAQGGFVSDSSVDGLTDVTAGPRSGTRADGQRYTVGVNRNGGMRNFNGGISPHGALSGRSDFDAGTEFTAVEVQTADGRPGRIFFGTATPGQLSDPVDADAVEVRSYGIGALTGDSFAADFTADLSGDLTLIEEQGEGYFREDGSPGFAKVAHALLAIEGPDTAQSSVLSVGTGRIRDTGNGAPSPDMGIYGSVRRGGSSAPVNFDATGTLIAFGDGNTVFSPEGEDVVFGSGSRFLFDGDDDLEVTPIRYSAFDNAAVDDNGFLTRGALSERESVSADARLPLGISFATAVRDNGFNNERDDAAFTGGYAAGMGVSRAADGTLGDPYILRSGDTEGARFAFDTSQNEVNASLNMVEGGSMAGTGGASDIDTLTYNFGSRSTRSALIDDRRFALRNKTTTDSGFVAGQTEINGRTGRPAPSAGTEQQAFRGALVSNDMIGNGADAIFAATTPDTDHEYLRWGWWSGEFQFDSDDTADFADRTERAHLGTWIAGNRLDPTIVAAQSGAAQFDGHVAVSMVRDGNESIQGGAFAMTYDFDQRSGNAEFRDIAGYDFDVAVAGQNATGAGSHYAGQLHGAAGARNLPDVDVGVSGAFFGDSLADSVRATAGQIDFQSSDDGGAALRASGVFGGDRVVP